MASSVWRKLPQEVKERFMDAAHKAKVEHAMKYPEYRFTPKLHVNRRRHKTKPNESEVLLRDEEAPRSKYKNRTAFTRNLSNHSIFCDVNGSGVWRCIGLLRRTFYLRDLLDHAYSRI